MTRPLSDLLIPILTEEWTPPQLARRFQICPRQSVAVMVGSSVMIVLHLHRTRPGTTRRTATFQGFSTKSEAVTALLFTEVRVLVSNSQTASSLSCAFLSLSLSHAYIVGDFSSAAPFLPSSGASN